MCHSDGVARSGEGSRWGKSAAPAGADRSPVTEPLVNPAAGPIERGNEPPVVARLVVEIRSDGRRTIARGAMEDAATGQGVAIEARGDSPLKLAVSLARAMLSVPALGKTATRALLRRPLQQRRRRGDD